eukprot:scaffold460094_cov13-Prasinocladus_malaysianus.AAC.1
MVGVFLVVGIGKRVVSEWLLGARRVSGTGGGAVGLSGSHLRWLPRQWPGIVRMRSPNAGKGDHGW